MSNLNLNTVYTFTTGFEYAEIDQIDFFVVNIENRYDVFFKHNVRGIYGRFAVIDHALKLSMDSFERLIKGRYLNDQYLDIMSIDYLNAINDFCGSKKYSTIKAHDGLRGEIELTRQQYIERWEYALQIDALKFVSDVETLDELDQIKARLSEIVNQNFDRALNIRNLKAELDFK